MSNLVSTAAPFQKVGTRSHRPADVFEVVEGWNLKETIDILQFNYRNLSPGHTAEPGGRSSRLPVELLPLCPLPP